VCGRFVSSSSAQRIAEHFGATFEGVEHSPQYNLAPTCDILGVVENDGGRKLESFHWGLVPTWATERSIGRRMINARSETLTQKTSFRDLFRTRRCIIAMDGFYEWRPGNPAGELNAARKPVKQPVYARPRDEQPLAVAGLWTVWRDPQHEPDWLHSATVITTSANATMAAVHDRMPVILPAEHWEQWLDPSFQEMTELSALLVPAPEELLVLDEVSSAVNNVRNQGPQLIEPRSHRR
jgi:putative SOS response-associated peptidase YedK